MNAKQLMRKLHAIHPDKKFTIRKIVGTEDNILAANVQLGKDYTTRLVLLVRDGELLGAGYWQNDFQAGVTFKYLSNALLKEGDEE